MSSTPQPGMPQAGRPPDDRSPGLLLWTLAFISFVLPWLGGGLAVAGVIELSGDAKFGLKLIGAGLALIAADLVLDTWLAKAGAAESAEPDLNRRGAQLIGRVLVVEEAIEGGRGKVRAGDTLWTCEGPALPQGASAVVTAANGCVLTVAARNRE